jgi:hypothetical protein
VRRYHAALPRSTPVRRYLSAAAVGGEPWIALCKNPHLRSTGFRLEPKHSPQKGGQNYAEKNRSGSPC